MPGLSGKPPYEVIDIGRGTVMLETPCPGCDRPYRIDSGHPEYQRILAALDAGNRDILRCYHHLDIAACPLIEGFN